MLTDEYYGIIKDAVAESMAIYGYEDVTSSVPGSIFAYTFNTGVIGVDGFSGMVYFGSGSGLLFAIGESTYAPKIPSRGISDDNVQLKALTQDDFIDIMAASAKVSAEALGISVGGSDDASFGSLAIISVSLMTVAVLVRRRKN